MNFFIWILIAVLAFFGISYLRSSPPEVVTAQLPTTVISKENMDSTLVIAINANEYQLSYLNDAVATKSKVEMQSFIKKYRTLNSGKILVKGNSQASYKRFKEVKDALKANEIYKFRIVTDGALMP